MRDKMANETIRRLSYIISSGPGAIVELAGKSVLLNGPDNWKDEKISYKSNVLLESLLPRITNVIGKLVWLRTDLDENMERPFVSFQSVVFPKLQVCGKCNTVYNYSDINLQRDDQPLTGFINDINGRIGQFNSDRRNTVKLRKIDYIFCKNCTENIPNIFQGIGNPNNAPMFSSAMNRFHKEASKMRSFRYVGVCSNGHIFDIDFKFWVHSRPEGQERNTCNSKEFRINQDYTTIACTSCNEVKNLQTLFELMKGQACRERYAYWLKYPNNSLNHGEEACAGKVQFPMKGDKKVWYSVSRSALNIIQKDFFETENFENIRSEIRNKIHSLIEGGSPLHFKNNLMNFIDNTYQDGYKRFVALNKAFDLTYNNNSINKSQKIPLLEENIRRVELKKLTDSNAENSSFSKSSLNSEIQNFEELSGRVKGVSIIEKIELHQTIVGLSRVGSELYENEESDLTVAPITKLGRYPTVGINIEGFLIEFNPESFKQWSAENILRRNLDPNLLKNLSKKKSISINEDSHEDLLEFYLLHSISHYLLAKLAFSSGYNIMGLRERLYFYPGTRAILIHTTDGDEEGSLGGVAYNGNLQRLEKFFSEVFDSMFQCANDPVCSESKPHGSNPNFAACHACLVLPETSCEFMNTFLDRNTLIGSGKNNKPKGFFVHE